MRKLPVGSSWDGFQKQKRLIFARKDVPYLNFSPRKRASLGRVVRVTNFRSLPQGTSLSSKVFYHFLEHLQKREKSKQRNEGRRVEFVSEKLSDRAYVNQPDISFEEFADFFLEKCAQRKDKSTLRMHEENLRRIKLFFKGRRLKSIRSVDIGAFLSYLEDEGAPSIIVSRHLRTLRVVLESAVQHGYLKKSPVEFKPQTAGLKFSRI